jgi:hypothetical protein
MSTQKPRRPVFLLLAAAAMMLGPGAAFAAEPSLILPPESLWVAQSEERTPPKPASPGITPQPEKRRDYALPALEILGFDFLLNRFNHAFSGSRDYDVSLSSIRRNLRSSWTTDRDPFRINQLGHPYQGSMYHGFARSAGFDFWESLGFTFVGSIAWEIAGENTPPSRNDQVASGIGGAFLGEALFRMASLVLETGGGMSPFWREIAAAGISPSTGFNRLAMGRKDIFDSRNPAYYSRLSLGFAGTTENRPGLSTTKLRRDEAQAEFSLDYGLPGKPGYEYRRPFDYFSFQATASSANGFENVMTRGLLFGRGYGEGDRFRGLWGLFGSYDYIAPQLFRVSSTGLSLGTTTQWWLTRSMALQGTAMAGAGYTAVGSVNSSSQTDYHYGVTPQALIALRLILGEKAAIDFTGREYFVSKVAAGAQGGHDNILRADLAFTWRIHKHHAISLKYLWSRRDATYPNIPDVAQTRATLGIFYTLLGHDQFGAVEYR